MVSEIDGLMERARRAIQEMERLAKVAARLATDSERAVKRPEVPKKEPPHPDCAKGALERE